MQTSHALALAHEHRVRIEDHIAAATALLSGDPGAARRPLARARWGLVQLLREYHLFKQFEIFDPLISSGSPAHAPCATELRRLCADSWNGFCNYTLEWSGRDVAGCWDTYRAAMLAMADAVRVHIATEGREMIALLAGAQRTRRLNG